MRQKLCRLCKEEVHVINGIRGKWCINHLVQVTLEKQKEKETVGQLVKRVKEEKKNDIKLLGKKTWDTFSLWIRNKYANFQGYVECYTCGRIILVSEAQAGHCFHRGKQHWKPLDFDEKHIRPQCEGCNKYSSGQTNIFQSKLVKEHGQEEVDNMIWRRANEKACTPEELKAIRNKYKKI